MHLLAEELEAIDFVNGVLGRLDLVKDDKGLTLSSEILPGDDVDDGAIFNKDFAEAFDQIRELDAFFEVFDLRWSVRRYLDERM